MMQRYAIATSRVLTRALVLWIAVGFAMEGCAGKGGRNTFYISPDGNDAWTGTTSKSDARKAEGPFASLQRALDAVATIRAEHGGTLPKSATIYFLSGTYFLAAPLVLTPETGGTDQATLTFAAAQDQTVVISGGLRVLGWQTAMVNGHEVWMAQIPEVAQGDLYFRQIWVNGQRRVRARQPNTGLFQVESSPDADGSGYDGNWWIGQTRFVYHAGDIQAWSTVTNADVIVMTRWVESRLPISSVDEDARTVNFSRISVFRLEPGNNYYMEGALEFLDSPGEWYLDRNAGTLYYMPMPGEDLNTVEVIVPRLSQLVRLEGDPESGQLVKNVVFRGLTFSHTEWDFPPGFTYSVHEPNVGGFGQAAVGVPGAVFAQGAQSCAVLGCTFARLGTYAVELFGGCEHNRIVGCTMYDLGAGGVKLGEPYQRSNVAEQTHDNDLTDCHIYDGGRFYHSAVGVWVGESYDNQIAYNHIHDFYYTGISIGWTWGYDSTLAKGNVVENNHVHHIGVLSNGDGPILDDMGFVYTLGTQPGTIIRNNIFHDSGALTYGGWGIYFDEGSSLITAENNLVYRTTHGGFHQHYGRENVVRNNIFALARDHQIRRTRVEDHLSFTFEGNIVYWTEGDLLDGSWYDTGYEFDDNTYWMQGGGSFDFAGFSWDAWRGRGMDVHSKIIDPLFADPANGDFTSRVISAITPKPSLVGPREKTLRKILNGK